MTGNMMMKRNLIMKKMKMKRGWKMMKKSPEDGEDEKKLVASGQSTEDTHQWIVKTLQKNATGAVYNTVVDEESATKHDTSDGIIIMSGTAYGGGTIIPRQRKEGEKLGKTIDDEQVPWICSKWWSIITLWTKPLDQRWSYRCRKWQQELEKMW